MKRAKPFDGGRRQAVAVAEAAGAETPSMIRTEKARVIYDCVDFERSLGPVTFAGRVRGLLLSVC